MAEKDPAIVSRNPSTVKRKSILSELGIQANGPPAKGATKPTDPRPTPSARKAPPSAIKTDQTASTSSTPSPRRPSTVPSSPSVNRSKTVRPSKTPLKKDPPAPIKVAPTRRRSVVPNSSASTNRPPMSPLAHRTPITRSPSTSHTKRLSTAGGLAELTINEKASEELLEQKEKEIETLKQESNQKTVLLEQEIATLKEKLEYSSIKNTQNRDMKQPDEQTIQKIEEQLKEELGKEHLKEINRLSEEHQKRLESKMAAQKEEHEKTKKDLRLKDEEINSIKNENNQLRNELQTKEEEVEHYVSKVTEITERAASLEEQVAALERSQANSQLRKLENELTNATSALVEHKRQSQQHLETIELRQREELRQLQSGTDDTAMAWLEKTKATQQEVDSLHDTLQREKQAQHEALETLKQEHKAQVEIFQEACTQKDAEIEERSTQIENLLDRVETLQNSLEAATARFEDTAKSTPSSSSTPEDINAEPGQHESCVKHYKAKQKELDDLKARFTEIKETHETQLNRLSQEKANDIQELRKKIAGLEKRASNNTQSSGMGEERLIRVAEQHKKEICMMHDQYQSVIDSKNKELEDYAYRVKAVVASKQKEIENMESKRRTEIERFKSKASDLEKEVERFQSLLEDTKKDCSSHRDENVQLLKLVNQLQVELQQVNTN